VLICHFVCLFVAMSALADASADAIRAVVSMPASQASKIKSFFDDPIPKPPPHS
jgi:hypothetical protein